MIYISIDMIDVGDASSCIVWIKDDTPNHCVMLIDGGNPDDGKRITDHLDKYILPHVNRLAPDIVIASHPDRDHCGGLAYVLQKYGRNIGELWIHDPAKHMIQGYYTYFKQYLHERPVNVAYAHILESLEHADSLISIADSVGIPRVEPFAGLERHNGIIKVLGPSVDFYGTLLPQFSDLEHHLQTRAKLFSERRQEAVYDAVYSILEIMDDNGGSSVLDAENDTSVENQSSAVVQVLAQSGRYIFPGDAGVAALVDIHQRTPLDSLYWLQIPHHGSRRNVTSELLTTMKPNVSYISAVGNKKHPRRALVNYLKKGGSLVYSTHHNGSLWHQRGDFPERADYSTATSL